jgi:hypothetical protein
VSRAGRLPLRGWVLQKSAWTGPLLHSAPALRQTSASQVALLPLRALALRTSGSSGPAPRSAPGLSRTWASKTCQAPPRGPAPGMAPLGKPQSAPPRKPARTACTAPMCRPAAATSRPGCSCWRTSGRRSARAASYTKRPLTAPPVRAQKPPVAPPAHAGLPLEPRPLRPSA